MLSYNTAGGRAAGGSGGRLAFTGHHAVHDHIVRCSGWGVSVEGRDGKRDGADARYYMGLGWANELGRRGALTSMRLLFASARATSPEPICPRPRDFPLLY